MNNRTLMLLENVITNFNNRISDEILAEDLNEIHRLMSEDPIDEWVDLCHYAWTIICNAGGGDWESEGEEWAGAATRFREKYHKLLGVIDEPYAQRRVVVITELSAFTGYLGTVIGQDGIYDKVKMDCDGTVLVFRPEELLDVRD